MTSTNYELIKQAYETYLNIKPKKPETDYIPILQDDRSHNMNEGTTAKQ